MKRSETHTALPFIKAKPHSHPHTRFTRQKTNPRVHQTDSDITQNPSQITAPHTLDHQQNPVQDNRTQCRSISTDRKEFRKGENIPKSCVLSPKRLCMCVCVCASVSSSPQR